MKRISIVHLIERIPDEAAAYHYLEELRWPDKPVCPHCGSINDHYFLKPKDEVGRRTRTGNVSQRRVWKCKDCRKQFSVLTGTIFHGSKVPVRLWIFVFFEMCSNKNGIAAREIERKYDVSPKTAWFMTQRIREAMAVRGQPKMVGIIEADETFVGGDPGRMNKKRRAAYQASGESKQPVMALINVRSGEVRAKVVPDVTARNLRKVMYENVQPYGSILYTDGALVYQSIGRKFARHEAVNHEAGEYVRDKATTNRAENFFGQFKRSLNGTHHHVSREHLDRYVSEFAFRHTSHHMPDTDRIERLMGQVVGRRLAYKNTIMP